MYGIPWYDLHILFEFSVSKVSEPILFGDEEQALSPPMQYRIALGCGVVAAHEFEGARYPLSRYPYSNRATFFPAFERGVNRPNMSHVRRLGSLRGVLHLYRSLRIRDISSVRQTGNSDILPFLVSRHLHHDPFVIRVLPLFPLAVEMNAPNLVRKTSTPHDDSCNA